VVLVSFGFSGAVVWSWRWWWCVGGRGRVSRGFGGVERGAGAGAGTGAGRRLGRTGTTISLRTHAFVAALGVATDAVVESTRSVSLTRRGSADGGTVLADYRLGTATRHDSTTTQTRSGGMDVIAIVDSLRDIGTDAIPGATVTYLERRTLEVSTVEIQVIQVSRPVSWRIGLPDLDAEFGSGREESGDGSRTRVNKTVPGMRIEIGTDEGDVAVVI
jgi:hypothetical protein